MKNRYELPARTTKVNASDPNSDGGPPIDVYFRGFQLIFDWIGVFSNDEEHFGERQIEKWGRVVFPNTLKTAGDVFIPLLLDSSRLLCGHREDVRKKVMECQDK